MSLFIVLGCAQRKERERDYKHKTYTQLGRGERHRDESHGYSWLYKKILYIINNVF